MSSNNNDNSGIFVFAVIIAVLSMVATIFYAIGLFLAFIYTIFAIMAWDKPLKLGKHTIEPEEARAFVVRGLLGAVLVPSFCAFCVGVFQVHINWDLLPHMIFGGYMVGSVGVEIMMAQEENDGASAPANTSVTYITPEPQAPRLPSPSGVTRPDTTNPASRAHIYLGQQVSGLSLSERKRLEQRQAAEEAEGHRFASWDDEEELRR